MQRNASFSALSEIQKLSHVGYASLVHTKIIPFCNECAPRCISVHFIKFEKSGEYLTLIALIEIHDYI